MWQSYKFNNQLNVTPPTKNSWFIINMEKEMISLYLVLVFDNESEKKGWRDRKEAWFE